jgi:hypothetical protein
MASAIVPTIDTTHLTPSGLRRFEQARELGYLVTLQGERNGPVDAVWSPGARPPVALA